MATSLPPSQDAAGPDRGLVPNPAGRKRTVKSRFSRARMIALGVLLVVLVACLTLTWTTRDAMANLPFLNAKGKPDEMAAGAAGGRLDARKTVVDRSPWETAQALAALAVSAEEVSYANEAQRLADHEVDQAFASALRQQNMQHRVLTGDALALSKQVDQLEQVVKDDEARIKSLMPNGVAPDPSSSEADDLDIAKAQLSLDSSVLDDAQEQLARASGDQRPQIQQELTAHEAQMAKYDEKAKAGGDVAILSVQRESTLASRIGAWLAQRKRHDLVRQAQQAAVADAAALTTEYGALEAQANKTAAGTGAALVPVAGGAALSEHAAKLAVLKQQSEQRQLVSIFNDRILTQKQLATVYDKWATQIELQHRIVMHLILQSIAVIAFILICVLLATALVHWLMRDAADGDDATVKMDQRRAVTLRTILEVSVQLIGVVLILLVVFGVPKQLSTVVGLATAGLTVALQDFIIAFLGWFVLMGKHGIRLGDSVEINGVTGEVIEVGLFRTTMLETGNSTDQGHPTGRRVAILNKFAVNGQYFNYSTAGQWMWDEISVSVPESDEAFGLISEIHEAVTRATEQDAQLAEQEWKRYSKLRGLSQFGASAQVNLRPAAGGVNLLIRYVTRASNRFEARNRLYQCVMDVLKKPAALAG